MRVVIKTILIFSLLAGIILCETDVRELTQIQSGSSSGPTGTASGSGSGSGFGLRGKSGVKPDGPRNLPPKNGGYSEKLAAITDEKIFQVKEVLKFLPMVEQDLLAGNLFNLLIR